MEFEAYVRMALGVIMVELALIFVMLVIGKNMDKCARAVDDRRDAP